MRIIYLKEVMPYKWGIYNPDGVELSMARYFETKAKAEEWARAWASTWIDVRVETVDDKKD